MSCKWCLRQFVSSNTQCFERDTAAVSPPAPMPRRGQSLGDLHRATPWV